MKRKTTVTIARAATIAAVYVTLTLLIYPIAFSGMQLRISEAMTLLPLLFPEAAIGLTIGCFISNIFGNGILDMIFGTLATCLSSVITMTIGKKIKNEKLKVFLGALPPVLINAFIVPFTFLALSELTELYFLNVLSVGIGQAIVVYGLGIPLYYTIKHTIKKDVKNKK